MSNPGTKQRTLKRFEHPGEARFLTFGCYRGLPLLQNDRIKQVLLKRMIWTEINLPVSYVAWVIMPNHVHLLVLRDPGKISMTRFLQALKRPVSAAVIGRWREIDADRVLRRVTDAKGKPHFWQRGGGYDRNICSESQLLEKIDYIHANPVRRELVKDLSEWPWSSARRYLGLEYEGPRITMPNEV